MPVLQLRHALAVQTMLPSVFSRQCLQRSRHSCIKSIYQSQDVWFAFITVLSASLSLLPSVIGRGLKKCFISVKCCVLAVPCCGCEDKHQAWSVWTKHDVLTRHQLRCKAYSRGPLILHTWHPQECRCFFFVLYNYWSLKNKSVLYSFALERAADDTGLMLSCSTLEGTASQN